MKIRKATKNDFKKLYEIGKNTPELKVSSIEIFMDPDEFLWALTNKDSIFLLAKEKKKIAGFIFAHAKDVHRPFINKYACLVYIVVVPKFRRKGIATKLYIECEKRIKKLGITNMYVWANADGSGEIMEFMERQGFAKGHKYLWMDKEL